MAIKNKTKPPKEVDEVCDLIEKDLADLVKSAREDLLAKVHPGEETPAETSPDTSAAVPPSSPPPGADAGGPPVDAPPGDAPPPAPGEETPGEAPPSHEEMVEVLRSLPPEQLQAWKAALDEVTAGGDAAGGAPPPDAGMGAGSPPPASPLPGPPDDTMKAEAVRAADLLSKAEVSLRGKDAQLTQMQAEIAKANDRLAKQESDLKEAAETIASWLRQPNRRGYVPAPVTEGDDPLKSLTKTELASALRQVARRPDLTVAQRKSLDNFVFHGQDADVIRGLLAKPAQK